MIDFIKVDYELNAKQQENHNYKVENLRWQIMGLIV